MSGTTLMGVAAPLLQQVIIEGKHCRVFPLYNVVIHGLVSFSTPAALLFFLMDV